MILEYVRIYDFKLFPDRLFDAKGADYKMEYLKGIGHDFPLNNPNHIVYGLIDDESVIHGILWLTYNTISHSIRVNIFSVDKEYQDKNNIPTVLEFIKKNHQIKGITKLEMASIQSLL